MTFKNIWYTLGNHEEHFDDSRFDLCIRSFICS